MHINFMDMGLANATYQPIYTLGPSGTSSEFASRYFCEKMKEIYIHSRNTINLNETYEEARDNIKKHDGLLVVANAYQRINDFYMDSSLKLLATFVVDTPLYGIATNKPLPNRGLTIASHPAPIPLIDELLPRDLNVDRIIETNSTSEAANAVINNEADIALTTEIAADLHNLSFISNVRPISMLWSVFASGISKFETKEAI
ncbi:bacilysin biosynthesis protein BacA [Photobacterium gaetbulicola]|uniref:Bacilysin biosynthesis protein BacA n=1 Tax=Photobacterium gaetbulicola TaxID=1295392 RepID=A0A0B9GVQ6_9GAMM|nr:bacilysin biosynthesis protein BacA [Photobacterium gaetbulicola]KHT62791.1 bacilysin biosynthesis protein BacA [Photobacterium gaetbulicola]